MKVLVDKYLVDFDRSLYVDNGLISFNQGSEVRFPVDTAYIVPGFIDRHTHGGYGVDFMDANTKANTELFKHLASEGITTVVPTTLTQSDPKIEKAVEAIIRAESDINKEFIHLEGPYINPLKAGAQNPEFIKKADSTLIEKYVSSVKIVSYAPELDEEDKLLTYLTDHQIIPSIVHSNAEAQQIQPLISKGLKNFSHFYNGSSGFSHRNPGVINAGLANNAYLELICDGYHIDPYVVKMTYDLKGIDNILLITDSMAAKGLGDGPYKLGGLDVNLEDGQVRLLSGSLAGSVLKMNDAVSNFYKFTNCDLGEAFFAASTNVANSLNLVDRGKIKSGYKFDITVLDSEFNVLETYVSGQKVYDASTMS